MNSFILAFDEKIQVAIDELKYYEPPDGYYVCFSGGKDTVVMYDLIKRAGVKYEAVHNFIAIEPPPLIEFIKREYPEVIIKYPEQNIAELIIKNGIPPLRHIRYCHRELKKGGEGRIKVLGIRAQESPRRASRSKFGENKFGGYDLNIIFDWTEQDIWRYIFKFNVKYCSLYDEGRKRIGCLFCPFGSSSQMEMDLTEFPDIAQYLIDACQAAIDRRNERRILEAGKKRCPKESPFGNGKEMFFHWISREGGKDIEKLKSIYDAVSI